VNVYPDNAARGLPTHQAMIMLFRSDTGEPLAVLDGRLITELRTAAVSAVATKLLSAPESRVLAILGSGVQARSHFRPSNWFAISRSSGLESQPTNMRRRSPTKLAQRPCRQKPPYASRRRGNGHGLVATVLQGAWLKPGVLVNAVAR